MSSFIYRSKNIHVQGQSPAQGKAFRRILRGSEIHVQGSAPHTWCGLTWQDSVMHGHQVTLDGQVRLPDTPIGRQSLHLDSPRQFGPPSCRVHRSNAQSQALDQYATGISS